MQHDNSAALLNQLEYTNKYDLTPSSIKELKILDWNKLKEHTWRNQAMKGIWWCHLEGCNIPGDPYDDFSEFWIGFNEDTNMIDYHFTTCEGAAKYCFDNFYEDITAPRGQIQVQANALKYLNMLIDANILGFSKEHVSKRKRKKCSEKQQPDYQKIYESLIYATRRAYDEYKRAVIQKIENTWIGNDGALCCLGRSLDKEVEKQKAFEEALKRMQAFKLLYADYLS